MVEPRTRCGCEYEWGVLVAFFAERIALGRDQIVSLTQGSADDPCWTTQRDRLLIRAVDELHDSAALTDALFAEMAEDSWRGPAPRPLHAGRLVPPHQLRRERGLSGSRTGHPRFSDCAG
ncbi:MAG: hypothetical protein GY698_02035 [Actinomycetia bacterium]|nr:hypothetical protein [Actinomycetes bacterium]